MKCIVECSSLSHSQCCFISQKFVACLIECGMALRAEQPHHDIIRRQTWLDRHSAPPVCPNQFATSQIVCKLNTQRPHTNRSSSCLYGFFSLFECGFFSVTLFLTLKDGLQSRSVKMLNQQDCDGLLMEWCTGTI